MAPGAILKLLMLHQNELQCLYLAFFQASLMLQVKLVLKIVLPSLNYHFWIRKFDKINFCENHHSWESVKYHINLLGFAEIYSFLQKITAFYKKLQLFTKNYSFSWNQNLRNLRKCKKCHKFIVLSQWILHRCTNSFWKIFYRISRHKLQTFSGVDWDLRV